MISPRLSTWFRRSLVAGVAVATLGVVTAAPASPSSNISLELLGTYDSGIFDASAAEIVKYDPKTERLFVVNAAAPGVDVLDVSNPASPTKVAFIDLAALGGAANSVAINKGVIAIAVEAYVKTDNGLVAFDDTSSLELKGTAPAGALPDMLTFTPNGRYVLVANEGEPNSDYSIDPEGSVTVISIKGKHEKLESRTIRFDSFNGQEDALRAVGVRIFGPGANAAQDFEPEYITVSRNSQKAFVALQENNAIAVLDLRHMRFSEILPLGFKDHSLPGNGIDASDRDDAINIANWPVYGVYMPDAIEAYSYRGKTYIVSANEGDAREYDDFGEDGFIEEARIKDLDLDETVFPNADDLQEDEYIGRLTVTTTLGDPDNDSFYEELYALGGRSFSIWDDTGSLVFDSGDAFEQITAVQLPANTFNSNNDENDTFDSRSDNKGPEPEGIVLGEIRGRTYAFIGLERVGGIMVYDITNPTAPEFIQYLNNRDFNGDAEAGTAGDLGPEGLEFIPASRSPNGMPMLAVGNEVSGSTSLYTIHID